LTAILFKKTDQDKSLEEVGALFKKSQLALIAILVAALLGAFASSMIPASGFQFNDVTMEDIEGFTIFADSITITKSPGWLSSMEMSMGTIDGITVVVMNSSTTEITNMRLIKEDLKINATKSVGSNVVMKVIKVVASNTTFTDLTMTDIPEFKQIVGGTVTLLDVEITAVYMFAETMTMWGMELAVS